MMRGTRRLPSSARRRAARDRRPHVGLDRRVQCRPGRAMPATADARLRQLPRTEPTPVANRHAAPTTCSSGRTADGTALRPRHPVDAQSYCTLSVLFSDWNRMGRRDLRMVERPALLRRRSCRRGAALEDRPRPAASSLHGGRRLGQQLRIWGMGIASQDLSGDGMPEVVSHQPGRQQAPDADRRTVLNRRTAGMPRSIAVSRPRQPFAGDHHPALDGLASGVPGRGTTTA